MQCTAGLQNYVGWIATEAANCANLSALPTAPHLQICFAPALREAGARRQLFANALALARETRGRSLVVSSGARRWASVGICKQ